MLYNNLVDGVMAQLVERLVRNEEASGSNPLSSTIKNTDGVCRPYFFVTLIERTAVLPAVRASNDRKRRMDEKTRLLGVVTLSRRREYA